MKIFDLKKDLGPLIGKALKVGTGYALGGGTGAGIAGTGGTLANAGTSSRIPQQPGGFSRVLRAVAPKIAAQQQGLRMNDLRIAGAEQSLGTGTLNQQLLQQKIDAGQISAQEEAKLKKIEELKSRPVRFDSPFDIPVTPDTAKAFKSFFENSGVDTYGDGMDYADLERLTNGIELVNGEFVKMKPEQHAAKLRGLTNIINGEVSSLSSFAPVSDSLLKKEVDRINDSLGLEGAKRIGRNALLSNPNLSKETKRLRELEQTRLQQEKHLNLWRKVGSMLQQNVDTLGSQTSKGFAVGKQIDFVPTDDGRFQKVSIGEDGSVIPIEVDGRPVIMTAQQIQQSQGKKIETVNNAFVQNAGNVLGKEGGKMAIEAEKSAVAAQKTINSIDRAIINLDANKGIISGSFANLRKNLIKILNLSGVTFGGKKVTNTETFFSNMGRVVTEILASGALGRGNAISDKDKQFVSDMIAQNITLSEDSIREILRIGKLVAEEEIDRANAVKFVVKQAIQTKDPTLLLNTEEARDNLEESEDRKFEEFKRELQNIGR